MPQPFDDACGVQTSVLRWVSGIGGLRHRVYLGTDADEVARATPGSATDLGEAPQTSTVLPSALAADTLHHWRVDTIDAGGAVATGRVWRFRTAPLPLDGLLLSRAGDASIREIPDVVDVDRQITLLGTGGSGDRVDRCTVFVFRLPNLGANPNPFALATLQFDVRGKEGRLSRCDLYGLGRRADPSVRASDYYGQTDTPDPGDARLLQAGIMDDTTPLGLVSTPRSARDLADYLNAQYGAGTGVHQHVFLRLNTAEPKRAIDRATITMSEGGVATPRDTRPQIRFASGFAPTEEENWRLAHFGTVLPAGAAGPFADPDADGEINRFEFGTAQDPESGSGAPVELTITDEGAWIDYRQNPLAIQDGFRLQVEWSPQLIPGAWTPEGITVESLSASPLVEHLRAALPTEDLHTRFFRLNMVR